MKKTKRETVPDDPYTIYVHEPPSFRYDSFTVEGGKITRNEKDGELRKITIGNKAGGVVKWELRYKKMLGDR